MEFSADKAWTAVMDVPVQVDSGKNGVGLAVTGSSPGGSCRPPADAVRHEPGLAALRHPGGRSMASASPAVLRFGAMFEATRLRRSHAAGRFGCWFRSPPRERLATAPTDEATVILQGNTPR